MEGPKGCLDLDTMVTLINALGLETACDMPHFKECPGCRAELHHLATLRSALEEITAPVEREFRVVAALAR